MGNSTKLLLLSGDGGGAVGLKLFKLPIDCKFRLSLELCFRELMERFLELEKLGEVQVGSVFLRFCIDSCLAKTFLMPELAEFE